MIPPSPLMIGLIRQHRDKGRLLKFFDGDNKEHQWKRSDQIFKIIMKTTKSSWHVLLFPLYIDQSCDHSMGSIAVYFRKTFKQNYRKFVVHFISDWNVDDDNSYLSNTCQIHNILCHTHKDTFWLEVLVSYIYKIYVWTINSQP